MGGALELLPAVAHDTREVPRAVLPRPARAVVYCQLIKQGKATLSGLQARRRGARRSTGVT